MDTNMDISKDINFVIRPLRHDEWHLIEETYKVVFNNAMPTLPAQSIFFGVFYKNELIGFTHLETLFSLNATYFFDSYNKPSILKAVYRYMNAQIPPGFAVLILPYKGLRNLMRFFGFRDLGEISVWRKDYD